MLLTSPCSSTRRVSKSSTAKTSSRCCFSRSSPRSDPPHPTSSKRSLPSIALGFACLLLFAARLSSQEIEYRTLPELLEESVAAFAQGDFPRAAANLNFIRSNYDEEPEWIEGDLPSKLLPLAGFASLKSGLYAEAVSALETYLESYSDGAANEAFARYALALSLRKDEKRDAARDAFSKLRQDSGNTAFRDLATLREAQLSDADHASSLLLELLESPTSQRIATQARLQLVRLYLETGQPDKASHQLLNTNWQQTAMPELATLSSLAFQVGDDLSENEPQLALRAYRLVSPADTLVEKQSRRIRDLQATLADRAPQLSAQQNAIWSEFYKETLASLQAQLSALEDVSDYTLSLDFRKARCFLQLNRPIEAWILLERVALANDSEVSPLAHLQWISAARQMRNWNAASIIAREYVRMYPDRDDADQALYWIAQSQIDQREFAPAIETLLALQNRTASPSLVASSHYLIGYCQAMQRFPSLAIDSFLQAAKLRPDKPIAGQATLWIGICQFSLDEFERAINTLETIEAKPDWSFLHAEAAYRRAACLFASGETENALTVVSEWLANYPTHSRQAEAFLLQGDLFRETGDKANALQSYSKVTDTDPSLRFYALKGSVEILLETHRASDALALLESVPISSIPLDLAANYYSLFLASLEGSGNTSRIESTIDAALAAFGNIPQAEGLSELCSLHPSLDESELRHRILSTRETHPTLSSRYTLALIDLLSSQEKESEARIAQLTLISDFPRESLSAKGLLNAAFALLEIDSLDTTEYFESISYKYPNSNYIPQAQLGLARVAAKKNEPQKALTLLSQLEAANLPTTASIQALELKARLLRETNQLGLASSVYRELLATRGVSPSNKASALLGLGEIELDAGNRTEAYQYFQRVFTLYRAEKQHVADAYLNCVKILSLENKYSDARLVADEFLSQTDLTRFPSYAAVETLLETLPSHAEL